MRDERLDRAVATFRTFLSDACSLGVIEREDCNEVRLTYTRGDIAYMAARKFYSHETDLAPTWYMLRVLSRMVGSVAEDAGKEEREEQ